MVFPVIGDNDPGVDSIFMYAIITSALNIIAGFADMRPLGILSLALVLYDGPVDARGSLVGWVIIEYARSIFAILLAPLRLRGHYFLLPWGSISGRANCLTREAHWRRKGITLPLPNIKSEFYAMIYFIMFGLLS